jgi:hypothetical protein
MTSPLCLKAEGNRAVTMKAWFYSYNLSIGKMDGAGKELKTSLPSASSSTIHAQL